MKSLTSPLTSVQDPRPFPPLSASKVLWPKSSFKVGAEAPELLRSLVLSTPRPLNLLLFWATLQKQISWAGQNQLWGVKPAFPVKTRDALHLMSTERGLYYKDRSHVAESKAADCERETIRNSNPSTGFAFLSNVRLTGLISWYASRKMPIVNISFDYSTSIQNQARQQGFSALPGSWKCNVIGWLELGACPWPVISGLCERWTHRCVWLFCRFCAHRRGGLFLDGGYWAGSR